MYYSEMHGADNLKKNSYSSRLYFSDNWLGLFM